MSAPRVETWWPRGAGTLQGPQPCRVASYVGGAGQVQAIAAGDPPQNLGEVTLAGWLQAAFEVRTDDPTSVGVWNLVTLSGTLVATLTAQSGILPLFPVPTPRVRLEVTHSAGPTFTAWFQATLSGFYTGLGDPG